MPAWLEGLVHIPKKSIRIGQMFIDVGKEHKIIHPETSKVILSDREFPKRKMLKVGTQRLVAIREFHLASSLHKFSPKDPAPTP